MIDQTITMVTLHNLSIALFDHRPDNDHDDNSHPSHTHAHTHVHTQTHIQAHTDTHAPEERVGLVGTQVCILGLEAHGAV